MCGFGPMPMQIKADQCACKQRLGVRGGRRGRRGGKGKGDEEGWGPRRVRKEGGKGQRGSTTHLN